MDSSLVISIIALLFSLYGAILSTVLARRQLRADRREIRMLMDLPYQGMIGRLIITNTGYRPITLNEIYVVVQHAGFGKNRVGWSKRLVTGAIQTESGDDLLPKKLTDGEQLIIPLEGEMFAAMDEMGEIPRVFVRDGQGNTHYWWTKGRGWPQFLKNNPGLHVMEGP